MPKVSDEHKDNVRRRIMDAAVVCLVRNDYQEITTRELLVGLGEVGVRARLDALRQGEGGQVGVGAVMAPAAEVLVDAIAAVRARHPRLQVSVRVETSDALVEALLASKLDFVLARIPRTVDPSPFRYREIGLEEGCLLTREGHPLARRGEVLPEQLEDRDWVLQPRGSLLRHSLEAMLRRHGVAVHVHQDTADGGVGRVVHAALLTAEDGGLVGVQARRTRVQAGVARGGRGVAHVAGRAGGRLGLGLRRRWRLGGQGHHAQGEELALHCTPSASGAVPLSLPLGGGRFMGNSVLGMLVSSWAGPAAAGNMKGLFHDHRQVTNILDQEIVLDHWAGYSHRVAFLKRIQPDGGCGNLP